MDGTGDDVKLLVAVGLRLIILVHVGHRDEIVGITVDEEHRTVALGKLLHGRGLLEVPAVAALRDDAGAVQDRERGQVEAVLQVVGELVPGGGVAAVLDEGADVGREVVAAHHHGRGSAHGHAVDHHEVILEDVVGHHRPVFHVQPVQPAHLGGLALGITVVLQVRDHDVVVELVPVHFHEVHEDEMVVRIAVHDDGGALCGGRILGGSIDGVKLVAVRIHAGDILDDPLCQCIYQFLPG